MVEPLNAVRECFANMNQLQSFRDSIWLLTNGKVEKQLKAFLGESWANCNREHRAFIMDKKFDVRLEGTEHFVIDQFEKRKSIELDLLVFDRDTDLIAAPTFWVEAKCSFVNDAGDINTSAIKAVGQACDALRRLRREFDRCPGYIVHFLINLPKENDPRLPGWVHRIYADLRERQPSRPETVLQIYEKYLGQRRVSMQQHFAFKFDFRVGLCSLRNAPDVYAIWSKLFTSRCAS
jgi:hypothetical protein